MIQISKEDIKKWPVIKQIITLLQSITFDTLQGISLYDLIKHYFIGLIKDAFKLKSILENMLSVV
jgi:hypothetical protein